MRKYWTKEEEDKLTVMLAQRKSVEQIAAALDRTADSIRRKKQSLDLTELNLAGVRAKLEYESVSKKLDALHLLINDTAAAATAALETAIEQEERRLALRDDLNDIEDYLAHSWLWRLFHSFEAYKRKLMTEE